MFFGEYQHKLDSKGRINVPAKFREILGTSFIMAKGLDGCIAVYHNAEWAKLDEKLEGLPTVSSKEARRFTRRMYPSAVPCETDDLGRVSIPQTLREHAGLVKEVVSIGVRDKVEIWDKQRWIEYNESDGYSDEEIAQKMSEFGI